MKTAKEILEKHYKNHERRIAFNEQVYEAMKEYASQFKAEQFPDTEADGYVFCGKCGKLKTL